MHTQNFKYRLGLFVAGGITLFILAIFIIGKQKNLFNPVFKLTSTFHNISGLQVGNKVSFSGINVGIVEEIAIINDSTVRVDMVIKKDVWQFIKSDCRVMLGSEGIIGDKILIILQGSQEAPLAKDGQSLISKEPIETNAIMAKLDVTADNAKVISRQLSDITFNINRGNGTLSRLIQDSIMAENLSQTIANLNRFSKGLNGSDVTLASLKVTAENAEDITHQLSAIINKINRGDGTLGRLIQDTTMAANLNQTLINLKKTSKGLIGTEAMMKSLDITTRNAEIISKQLAEVSTNINSGNGTISRLIRDSAMAENLNLTLINLKKSSKGLDENMTAVKHNFLFRHYFDKKAKQASEKKIADKKIADKNAQEQKSNNL